MLITITTNVNADSDFTKIEHNASFKQYAFENHQLYYAGKSIFIDKLTSGIQTISISESPDKKHAILLTYDDNDSKGYIINLKEYIAREIPLDGPPLLWTSWSPRNNFLIMGSYYEADMKLYSIAIPSVLTKLIEPKINIKTNKENGDLEEIHYDIDNSKWINEKSFQVQTIVKCNPYGDNQCTDSKRLRVLKSFTLTINVENHSVTEKRTD